MQAKILDGKVLSQKLMSNLKLEVDELVKAGKTPSLAVVIVGDDAASKIYVDRKKKACANVGIVSHEFVLSADTSQTELLGAIEKLNHDSNVHGILVQLPLPKHIDEKAVILAIDPKKDVDAFHPANVGKIMIGDFDYLPCTPAGIMELIEQSGVEIVGKECVVVGRSNIVGKPQAMLLLHKDATVTICHSKTKNLAEVTKRADILVAAVGRANMITADMIKPGAVVIDVGMNRLDSGKVVGDVDFDSVSAVAGHITPVPGGVGPMTIATLMKNTVTACKLYG